MLRAIEQYLSKVVSLSVHFIFLLLFVRFFFVEPGVVDGQSMEPTFKDNNFFLVNKIGLLTRSPKRFEVVQFLQPETKTSVIKRIIGLPGETVTIRRNAVFINNSQGDEYELPESYLPSGSIIQVRFGLPAKISVPAYAYMLLGDNRMYSTDSREYGPVHRDRMVGKVMQF